MVTCVDILSLVWGLFSRLTPAMSSPVGSGTLISSAAVRKLASAAQRPRRPRRAENKQYRGRTQDDYKQFEGLSRSSKGNSRHISEYQAATGDEVTAQLLAETHKSSAATGDKRKREESSSEVRDSVLRLGIQIKRLKTAIGDDVLPRLENIEAKLQQAPARSFAGRRGRRDSLSSLWTIARLGARKARARRAKPPRLARCVR
jgi:hypothetical protein